MVTASHLNGNAKQLAIAALATTPMLEGVPLPQRAELAETGTIHHYRAGAFVFIAGDASDAVYCVVDGRVQIESSREDDHLPD